MNYVDAMASIRCHIRPYFTSLFLNVDVDSFAFLAASETFPLALASIFR